MNRNEIKRRDHNSRALIEQSALVFLSTQDSKVPSNPVEKVPFLMQLKKVTERMVKDAVQLKVVQKDTIEDYGIWSSTFNKLALTNTEGATISLNAAVDNINRTAQYVNEKARIYRNNGFTPMRG